MLPGVEERSERLAEVDKVILGCLRMSKVDGLCTLSEQSKLQQLWFFLSIQCPVFGKYIQ